MFRLYAEEDASKKSRKRWCESETGGEFSTASVIQQGMHTKGNNSDRNAMTGVRPFHRTSAISPSECLPRHNLFEPSRYPRHKINLHHCQTTYIIHDYL